MNKYLFLLLILMGCGKIQPNVYHCPTTQICYQMCTDLHPNDAVAREQCFAEEVDRLTGEENYKILIENLDN